MSHSTDRLRLVLSLAAGIAMVGVVLVCCMIFAFALPVFTQSGAATPFSWVWLPYRGEFGILPMIVGSLLLSGLALGIGWPFALALTLWLLGGASNGTGSMLRAVVRAVIRGMTAIPTVVYGFAAVFLLTPLIRRSLGGTGMSWLTAGLVLSLLILPTLILVLEAGLKPRLERLCPHGLALGFTRLELLWLFVVPQAKASFMTAIVLGFGRAIGDTLVPLMLAGNAPQVPLHLTDSLRTLTAHMALVTANEVGGSAYNSLFVAGALLLGINALVSMTLRRLGAKS